MICPVCTCTPCCCLSKHWNHWVESDTIEKFDAFVKSLQKKPGLIQRIHIDHYVKQLQELCRNPDHVVTSIGIDSLGGRDAGVPFQYHPFGGLQNPSRHGQKYYFPRDPVDRSIPRDPAWDALLGRLTREPGLGAFLNYPTKPPRRLDEMPVAQLTVAVKKLLEERLANKQHLRDNPQLFNIKPVDYLPRMGNTIDYLEIYRKMANIRSHLPAYSLDNIARVDFKGEPRMSVDFQLCNDAGKPIERVDVDLERSRGIVVLSQKARQGNVALQYQVLGGGFPRDGVPLLHSGLVCDEELIYPNELTGKSGLGFESIMESLRIKRKKQEQRKFWVEKQQPSWAGGRKRGKR